jgi:hypothetical protein
LAFGENLTYGVRVVVVLPVHGVILSSSCLAQFTASLRIRVGAALHLFFE